MEYNEGRKKSIKARRRENKTIATMMTIMSIVLFVICILLFFLYYKEKNKTVEAMSKNAEFEQQLENGNYITKEEADVLIAEAKTQAEENVLNDIQRRMEEGTTTLTLLEILYPEKVVASDRGRYYFFEINENLAQNPFRLDALQYPVLNEETGEYEGDVTLTEAGQATMRKGVDVSKFQGKINWNKVANDGIEYAYIRLGYRGYGSGKIVTDETYEYNISGCNSTGIDTGVYFFTEAISVNEAVEEADYVLENIQGYRIDLPIVLDVEESASEDSRTKNLTAEERTEIVKAFCNRIIESGHEVMIYGNMKSFLLMLNMEELEEYDKWFAYYKFPLRFPYQMRVWQYTASGKVDGIQGNVDINVAFY